MYTYMCSNSSSSSSRREQAAAAPGAAAAAAAKVQGMEEVWYLDGVVYKRYGDSDSILGGLRRRQRK